MSPLPDPHRTLQSREPVRFLVFAASLRAASLNAQLTRLAARLWLSGDSQSPPDN